MKPKLKVFAPAVLAVFLLSAIALTTSAQAGNGKLTSTGYVTLTGSEIAGKSNRLTAFGLAVECPGSTYTGHDFDVTPHGLIAIGEETVTLTPKYKQPCKTTVGPSTIDMNGCDFVLHFGETNGVADQYAVTYDLVCPPNSFVTVTNWFSEAEHKEDKESCELHIEALSTLKGGTVTDTTSGDLVLGGPVKGLKIREIKDGLHPILCPEKLGEGELDIGLTVKGDNAAGSDTTISLSHN